MSFFYSKAGFYTGVISLVLTICLFVYQETKPSSQDLIENSIDTQPILHTVSGDFTFYLNQIKDDTYPNRYIVKLQVQARKTPILLMRKAKVKKFVLVEDYFLYKDDYFRKFKIVNVKTNKISLEKKSEIAEIELIMDTTSIFINPHDLVWNAEDLKDREMGHILVEFFYQYKGKEESETIRVPIRFA